jgi:hypothetical protein
MLLTDSHTIREVVLFPLLRSEGGGAEEVPAAEKSGDAK